MRPLVPGEPIAFRVDPVPELLDRYGAYCAICERPLYEYACAWDTDAGETISPHRQQRASGKSLLLCRTCETAQARSHARFAAEEMALPFDDPTFVLGGGSAFSYDRSGWVGPRDERARVTVDRFVLDRQFLGDELELDPRRPLRLRAWGMAETVGEDALAGDDTVLRNLIAATGFLSVWLTVLGERFGAPAAAGIAARPPVAPGTAQTPFFPGTDWGRLLTHFG